MHQIWKACSQSINGLDLAVTECVGGDNGESEQKKRQA